MVGDPRVACGSCPWCRQGKENICPELSFIGEICPGCFAEYLVLNEEHLLKLPSSLELDRAALIEPLAVALHAAGKAGLSSRETLGIIGAGPVGLLTLLAARPLVEQILVVDRARSGWSWPAGWGPTGLRKRCRRNLRSRWMW